MTFTTAKQVSIPSKSGGRSPRRASLDGEDGLWASVSCGRVANRGRVGSGVALGSDSGPTTPFCAATPSSLEETTDAPERWRRKARGTYDSRCETLSPDAEDSAWRARPTTAWFSSDSSWWLISCLLERRIGTASCSGLERFGYHHRD